VTQIVFYVAKTR